MKRFPKEILDIIFGIIRQELCLNDLCQCALVCNDWRMAAQRSLYSQFELSTVEQVETLIQDINNKSSSFPEIFVRRLVYNKENEKKNTWPNYLVNILAHIHHVLKAAFIRLHGLNPVKFMESSPNEYEKLKNSCILMSLTALKIHYVYDGNKEDINYNFYKKLNLFPNIKELYTKTSKYNFFQSIEHATEIMHNLELVNHEYLTNTDFNTLNDYKRIYVSLITPQPNIKDLTIHSTSYENDNFLLYLMTKFSGLQRIIINPKTKDCMAYDSIIKNIKSAKDSFSVPIISAFMEFVSRCDFYSVDLFYTTLDPSDILNSYWNLCDHNEQKVLVLSYEKERNWPDSEQSKGRLLSMGMGIDLSTNTKSIVLNFKYSIIHFQHFKLLEICGNKIDHLSLRFGSKKWLKISREENKLINIINGDYFIHILHYCTRLKSLCIANSRIVKFTFKLGSFANTSITTLTLDSVTISYSTLSEISEKIPCLKKLVMKSIYFDEKGEEKSENLNRVIDMPLISFEYLFVRNFLIQGGSSCYFPIKISFKISLQNSNVFYNYEPFTSVDPTSKIVFCQDLKVPLFARATLISEEEYNNELENNKCLNLHIKCKSFEHLAVSLEARNPSQPCCISMKDNRSIFMDEEVRTSFIREFL